MLYNTIKKITILSLFLALVSCGSDKKSEDPETDFDVNGMLVNMADNIIVPAYTNLNAAILKLEDEVSVLDTTQSTNNLTAVKEAYLALHLAWHKAAMFDFGPAQDMVLRSAMNTYPIVDTLIQSNIAEGNYNLGTTSNLQGATGLNALDYLLYGIETPLTVGEIDYIQAIVKQMKTKVGYVLNEWNTNYRDTFVNNLGTSNSSSVSLLLNDLSLYTEKNLRTGKIRIPAGLLPTSSGISLNHIEAKYSANYSSTYIQTSLQAVSDYYYGIGTAGDGIGFDEYLQALDTDYNQTKLYLAIREKLSETIQEASTLNNPYAAELQNNHDKVEMVYNQVQDLVILIKNHMTVAIGVRIGYVDTDGD